MLNNPLGTEPRVYDLGARSGLLSASLSTSQAVDDADTMSCCSSALNNTRPSVIGLRDRLLREARNERQRFLESAEAADRHRNDTRRVNHVGIQTDPVQVTPFGQLDVNNNTDKAGTVLGAWSQADDQAQREALRTIQMLGEQGHQSRFTEDRVSDLEAELRAERASRQEMDQQVAHERSRKEAAQQQVLCLEYELDGKEAALQVAERALERRDADLQQAQLQLRSLQEGADQFSSFAASSDDSRVKALRGQLVERERQLELKDQHISRLLNVLRQHRSIFVEEDSTVCGSERSMTVSTVTTTN